MFVIMRKTSYCEDLQIGESLFPRPTPWFVAWDSFLRFLTFHSTYQFAFVPPDMEDLFAYQVTAEGNHLIIRDTQGNTRKSPILSMTWGLWWEYAAESFIYGLFFRFWNWRWRRYHSLTKDEMQAKINALESRLARLTPRRSELLEEQEDEDE